MYQIEAKPIQVENRDVLVLSPTPTYPLDAGNRRRIFAYCDAIKSRGYRIHFLYYGFEWDHLPEVPTIAMRKMSQQWEGFYFAPPTRPIQSLPKNKKFHTIDEWWDAPALEPILRHIFKKQRFYAFIVNYPYLRKAFDFCPKTTLKILDTHDKFTDRDKLFESRGLPKEFFFTRNAEEAKSVSRADVVWAIKPQEEQWFRSLNPKKVVRTLPHAEESRKRPGPNRKDEYVRFGITGARNTINAINITEFVRVLIPAIRKHLAPIRLVLAGSICDIWGAEKIPPEIEIFGRYEDPAEFYGEVDAVVIPISFSSGLKIKAIEALNYGVSVYGLSHAFEGIPTDARCHNHRTLESLVDELISVSFCPETFALGEKLSLGISDVLRNQVKSTLDLNFHANPQISDFSVVTEFDSLKTDFIFRYHIIELIWRISKTGRINFYCLIKDEEVKEFCRLMHSVLPQISLKQIKLAKNRAYSAVSENGNWVDRESGSGFFIYLKDLKLLSSITIDLERFSKRYAVRFDVLDHSSRLLDVSQASIDKFVGPSGVMLTADSEAAAVVKHTRVINAPVWFGQPWWWRETARCAGLTIMVVFSSSSDVETVLETINGHSVFHENLVSIVYYSLDGSMANGAKVDGGKNISLLELESRPGAARIGEHIILLATQGLRIRPILELAASSDPNMIYAEIDTTRSLIPQVIKWISRFRADTSLNNTEEGTSIQVALAIEACKNAKKQSVPNEYFRTT